MGVSTSESKVQARPWRLPDVLDEQIYIIRAWIAWEKWELFLLFSRLQVHHQDDSSCRAQIFAENPQGVLLPRRTKPKHSPIAILWPSQSKDAIWKEDTFRRHE